MLIAICISFIAGLLSFFSPCVLPIFPGYLSFISGIGIEKLINQKNENISKKIITSSIFFIIGFSLIFISLGASASTIGSFLQKNITIISIIAGIGIILFGFHMIGLFKIPFLYREKKFYIKSSSPNIIHSFLAGIFFAFGWTPCIGPVLAAILTLAAISENLYKGVLLLTFYSIGLAIPFLLSAFFIKSLIKYLKYISNHLKKIEIVLGIILIILGILISTNKLFTISSRLAVINFDKLIPKSWAEKIASPATNTKISRANFEIQLPDINGTIQDIYSIKANLYIINFWATWCPPCQYEMPDLEALYKKYKHKGVFVVGIAEKSSLDDIKKFINDKKISYMILVDENYIIADKYNVTGLPSTFILNSKGENLASYDRYASPEQIEKIIQKYLPN
jgi:cytochrome c-type biogenesis protein